MSYSDNDLARASSIFEDKLEQLERGEIHPDVEDVSDLREVADLALAVEAAQALLRERVTIARARGRSWTEIARPLGVSRQAARQRFGSPNETIDTLDGEDVALRTIAATDLMETLESMIARMREAGSDIRVPVPNWLTEPDA
jgi:hypothetical protein